MKKTYIYLACAVLSFSCSLEDLSLNSAGTPTPLFTSTNTYTPIPTVTPITPTLTFTLTPTLSGLKSPTLTQEISASPVVSITPLALITPNTATPTLQMEGFVSVSISENEFYKGNQCEPASIKFVAQVADPVNSAIVDLFVRFKSKRTGTTGEWTRITMQTIGAGTFTHDLVPEELKGIASFQNAWVQYQFVVNTSRSREIGRTAIISEALTLLDCSPTPTPAVTPTPTVLKP